MSPVAVDPIEAVLALGEDGRAEWAEGSLIEMAPPPPDHIEKSDFLTGIIQAYTEKHDLGKVFGDGLTLRLAPGVVRVPDASFVKKENLGRIGPTFVEGGADLIVEIVSRDSRVRDRHAKYFEYAEAGVEEYWIVDPLERTAEFHRLREGAYHPVLPDAEGRVFSSVLPGFFVRVAWLWKRPTLVEAMRDLGLL